jgi:hypothetical protein
MFSSPRPPRAASPIPRFVSYSALRAMFRYKPVNERSCDAYISRYIGELICFKPSGVEEFLAIDFDFSARVLRGKGDHKGVGERPGLASEIADIFNVDPRLFFYFACYRFFEGFSRFNKTGDDAIKFFLKPARAGKEHFVIFLYKNNYGRRNAGEHGKGACGALPREHVAAFFCF